MSHHSTLVYHADAEYGLRPGVFSLEKVIEVASVIKGKLVEMSYLNGYTEPEIEQLKTKVSEFTERDLTEEYHLHGIFGMSLDEYIQLWINDHATNCENLKRLESVEYSVVVRGT